ncbi:hypothetical protein E4T45_05182, partial [Aureobasidium sp. EXF-8846]
AFGVAEDLLEHLATKPTAILVAVLWHDIPLPLADIRDAYLGREEAPADVLLRMGSVVPSGTIKVGDLDHFNDKVIVFHARSVDPLTTTNTMDGATSSTSNNTSNGTSNNTSNDVNSAHSSFGPWSSVSSVASTPRFAVDSMGNSISVASLSAPPASTKYPSVSPRTSLDPSRPYAVPSARMSSSSSKSGYAAGPTSPLVNHAPGPSTPIQASPRGSSALSSARRQSSVNSTSTRYAQSPGHPPIKDEPVAVPPHHHRHIPYTPPTSHIPQSQQAAPRPQGLSYGLPHDTLQYAQPNGNVHAQPADQALSTHPVSSSFVFLFPPK